MRKILLGLLAIGLLVGCTSIKKSKETTGSIVESDMENVNLPTCFKIEKSKKMSLGNGDYYIYSPTNIKFKYEKSSLDFCFNDNDDNEIGVQILSIKLLEMEKEERYSSLGKIVSDDSIIVQGRDYCLLNIEPGFNEMIYQNEYSQDALGGKEALLDKGIAIEKSDKNKKLNYARFDFFIDNEQYFPCEITITSSDNVDINRLEKIARELVGLIHKK